MTDLVAVAAILTAWAAAALLFVCLHGARRTARLHQQPRRRRRTIPPGSNEGFGPTLLDRQFEEIKAILWQDEALRVAWCPRPVLEPYESELAARAVIRAEPNPRGLRAVRCDCGSWHIRTARPRARR